MAAGRIRIVARLGHGSFPLPPFVLWSAVGHVVFIAALILLPSLRPKKPFPDLPIVVDLVSAARPAAKASAPASKPPAAKAEPTPPPDTARLETREPPKPKPLPEDPKPEKKPAKKPSESPPPQPVAPPVQEETQPSPGAAGGEEGPGGASVVALEGGDVRFAWYRDSVTAALHGQWRRPILERLMEAVEVRVSFEILRDGSVRSVRIETPSGVSAFDRSALRAVADASPLPPLPLEWREPTLAAAFVFRLHPE